MSWQLITRLEKATAADRELDAEIDCLVRFPHLRPAKPDDHREHFNCLGPSKGDIWSPTGFLLSWKYTSSIDAAATLVPDNVYWMAGYTRRTLGKPVGACALYRMGNDRPFLEAQGHSVALALCIAAIRAITVAPQLSPVMDQLSA